jgi:hypothetical protein
MTVVDIRNLPEKPALYFAEYFRTLDEVILFLDDGKPLGLLMPLAGTEYIPSEEDLEWAKKEMS